MNTLKLPHTTTLYKDQVSSVSLGFSLKKSYLSDVCEKYCRFGFNTHWYNTKKLIQKTKFWLPKKPEEKRSLNNTLQRGYKFVANPNKTQEKLINRAFGASRFVWNWALHEYQEILKLNPSAKFSLNEISKKLTLLKKTETSKIKNGCVTVEKHWLNFIPDTVLRQSLRDLAKAFEAYENGKNGVRKDKPGNPKFKSRNNDCFSATFQVDARVEKKKSYLVLSSNMTNSSENLNDAFLENTTKDNASSKHSSIRIPGFDKNHHILNFTQTEEVLGEISSFVISKKNNKYHVSLSMINISHKQIKQQKTNHEKFIHFEYHDYPICNILNPEKTGLIAIDMAMKWAGVATSNGNTSYKIISKKQRDQALKKENDTKRFQRAQTRKIEAKYQEYGILRDVKCLTCGCFIENNNAHHNHLIQEKVMSESTPEATNSQANVKCDNSSNDNTNNQVISLVDKFKKNKTLSGKLSDKCNCGEKVKIVSVWPKDANKILAEKIKRRNERHKKKARIDILKNDRLTDLEKEEQIFNIQDIFFVKSNRQQKVEARLTKSHELKKNYLTDAIHKATTDIIRNHHTIVLETIDVKSMLKDETKSKGFHRSVANTCLSIFRNQLVYKTNWCDRNIIFVDKWFPSSQLCSTKDCNYRNKDLTLGTSSWTCPTCNTFHERDSNASFNLWTEGWRILEEFYQENSTISLADGSSVKGSQEKHNRNIRNDITINNSLSYWSFPSDYFLSQVLRFIDEKPPQDVLMDKTA